MSWVVAKWLIHYYISQMTRLAYAQHHANYTMCLDLHVLKYVLGQTSFGCTYTYVLTSCLEICLEAYMFWLWLAVHVFWSQCSEICFEECIFWFGVMEQIFLFIAKNIEQFHSVIWIKVYQKCLMCLGTIYFFTL